MSSPDATEISGLSKKTLLFALLPWLSGITTKHPELGVPSLTVHVKFTWNNTFNLSFDKGISPESLK